MSDTINIRQKIENSKIRLKKALKELKMNQEELSVLLNIKHSAVKAMGAGNKKITPDIAEEIEVKTGISSAWLLLEKGAMFDKQPSALTIAMGNDEHSRLAIPYFPDIKASARNGYQNSEDSEIDIISLPKALFGLQINTTKIEAIRVHGDSMYPTIDEGDVIFLNKKTQDIIDGKIYVMKYNDEIYIKRLFKRKDTLIIKSDNSIYPQDEYKYEDVKILGNVIYNLSTI